MNKRLFLVTAPFSAFPSSGDHPRTLQTGQALFSEYPVAQRGVVIFEQDNQEFQTDAKTFNRCTILKELEDALNKPSFGAKTPPKCKTCGDQKAEHQSSRGPCNAMKVVNARQVKCECKQFVPEF
ncbi:MAG TPA: hypothetical protein VFA68_06300 [Terriglobales bacterium]|nr:hypothetical protein [Terriglobales bacterium]